MSNRVGLVSRGVSKTSQSLTSFTLAPSSCKLVPLVLSCLLDVGVCSFASFAALRNLVLLLRLEDAVLLLLGRMEFLRGDSDLLFFLGLVGDLVVID